MCGAVAALLQRWGSYTRRDKMCIEGTPHLRRPTGEVERGQGLRGGGALGGDVAHQQHLGVAAQRVLQHLRGWTPMAWQRQREHRISRPLLLGAVRGWLPAGLQQGMNEAIAGRLEPFPRHAGCSPL